MKRFLTVFLCASALLSCTRGGGDEGLSAIPYVTNILSGTVPGRGMLVNASAAGRRGEIYVFGDSAVCARLRDSLLVMDSHDNASGAAAADYLPDFAGETFACLEDSTLLSAWDFLCEGDTVGLRRLAVNILLGAVDTSCYLSRFDISGLGSKKPAKQLVLADPAFAVYGKYDVDTLLQATGSEMRLFVPAASAFEELASHYEGVPAVAVMSAYDSTSYCFYSEICSGYFPQSQEVYCHGSGTLRELVDSYILAGFTQPLDALVVDCCAVNMSDLYGEYERMTDVHCEDYVVYSNYFSSDFRLVSSFRCVMEQCYSDMRARNLFTHDIAMPEYEKYCCVPFVEDNSAIKLIECSR